MNYNPVVWKLMNIYFKDNPQFIVKHHLESYNDFFGPGLSQLLREKNPIHFFKEREVVTIDKETKHIGFTVGGRSVPLTFEEMEERYVDKGKERLAVRWSKGGVGPTKTVSQEEYKYQAKIYLGGKNGDKIYYGRPVIHVEGEESRFMYPNEARLKNMTYAFTIHYDVDIDFTLFIEKGDGSEKHTIQHHESTIERIFLGRFPIMLQSNLCILNGMSANVRFNMGECRNDPGGYFIVDGKEKVIIAQEKFADNTLYIQENPDDIYSYSAKIRSVSEDASKPIRTLTLRMVGEQPSASNRQIVISIPNVRKPVPLFILMRALGVISDKEIIEYCLLDLNKFSHYVDDFRPSIHDAGLIFTQQAAIKFIATLTKGKTKSHALQILAIYFLPHIGELNFKQKALYVGYITKRMLQVMHREEKPTNRDSYIYKRIEISGMLIRDLFREYLTQQQNNIYLLIDTRHLYAKRNNAGSYQNESFMNVIMEDYPLLFKNRIVENGFRKAFKGDWGAEAHTKRPGVLQDLSRLSFWSSICQLRKTNVPITTDSAKIIGPRLLNSTQWGILCPIHTPDGGNVGLHKHLSMTTHITSGCSGRPFIEYLRGGGLHVQLLEECSLHYLSQTTKVFVNGAWVGVTGQPRELHQALILRRRHSLYNPFISIRWNIERNEILIQTDAGRPCHPLLIVTEDHISYQREEVAELIESGKLTWKKAIQGLNTHNIEVPLNHCAIYSVEELFGTKKDLSNKGAVVEYIDTQEMEGVKLASYDQPTSEYEKNNITHSEIHPSVILGIMANQIIYPSNNPYPRDLFSCGQSKQAASLYHSNYQNRMDKSAIILHYGQTPIVRSRYLRPITKDQHPYGVNAIVAVASYTGYNVEDAVIMNKGALDRGLFGTTYLNVYEAEESSTTVGKITLETRFMNIEDEQVIGMKPGYDYSHLDKQSGLITENTIVDDKTILIGRATTSLTSTEFYIDDSVGAKKGQTGHVDKAFMTRGEDGVRLAKIRIRHDRKPVIGDKFCSRAGQKGTIGIILPESDMPFTAEGVRPDLIVNPHAMPSRMTIGHLVESLVGKACLLYGGSGDSTAFINKGPKDKAFGSLLTQQGFHSSGNEVLYNGMNGEQLEAEIYFGPTYYLRLKHMTKDKINYRARGPRTILTRQTVQGRANNGGLRIGEMDRDAIIASGMAGFLNESMMVRGDEFYMAICNKTGTIAIYNKSRNLFLSPMADGPIKFVGNLEGELNIVPISRFGRDFSILHIPYSFKLLYQELQTMNIQMRIITAANVDQLTSLAGRDGIKALRGPQRPVPVPTGPLTFQQIGDSTERYLKGVNSKYRKLQAHDEKIEREEGMAILPNKGEIVWNDSFKNYTSFKNLIIICAGNNSYHYKEKWYSEGRQYVLCVIYYGIDESIAEKYKETCDIFLWKQGLKWKLIQGILGRGGWWQSFDRIAFPDDDIAFKYHGLVVAEPITAFQQLNKLFRLGATQNFMLWQPALSDLNAVHALLRARIDCNYRYVNFVESMIPFFSRFALQKCIRVIMDRNIGTGWGIDYAWATRLISDQTPKGLAVIDEIVIIHTRPVAQNYPKGVDPHKDKERMIEKYNVRRIAEQNPAVFPPGKPYQLITIKCVESVVGGDEATGAVEIQRTVPEGLVAGDDFTVYHEGSEFQVTVPVGAKGGTVLILEVPVYTAAAPKTPENTVDVEWRVPEGLKPGDTFIVEHGGGKYEITVPEGTVEGEVLVLPLPAILPPSEGDDIFGTTSTPNPFYVPEKYKDPFAAQNRPGMTTFPFGLQPGETHSTSTPPSPYSYHSLSVASVPAAAEEPPGPSVYIPVSPLAEGEETVPSSFWSPGTSPPTGPSAAKPIQEGGAKKPMRIVLKKDFQKGLEVLKTEKEETSSDKKSEAALKNTKIIK